jgi:glutamate-ammonia-ligase adenylyltransferase
VTNEDCVFHVDLRLRPEGSQGAIANSLASTGSYYESFGRPWERQTWLKARPCAGDMALGQEVMDMMRPFIYPRNVSASVIDEVQELNNRIKDQLAAGSVDRGFDLKNGYGGIREIEFFVQALQLIHAGHRPKLQTRSTIVALDELLFGGLISETERHGLAEAYRYMRHLEHMIQLESGRQTQRLPTQAEELNRLAKRTNHQDKQELLEILQRHTELVQSYFETLGDDAPGPPAEVRKLLQGTHEREQEETLLKSLGFRDIEQAWQNLHAARQRVRSPFGATASSRESRVALQLLTEIAVSPDPDQALQHLRDLVRVRRPGLWIMMDDNPSLLRLVASVFGTSQYLSKSFINHPELFDSLLAAGWAKATRSQSNLAKVLANREIDRLGDREQQWSALAEFKNSEVLRIGLADIAGALEPVEVCEQLSDVAELSVQCAYSLVADDLRARHGLPTTPEGENISMAVMALGKLGGRELGYASDLDLIFVYSADGTSDGQKELDATTYMSRIAQRMMRGLHSLHPGGRLYEIDTRLRPSGSQGLLVSSMAAWTRYHQTSARLWEKQALTKLRWVAGDRELGEKVSQVATQCIYDEGLTPLETTAQGIARMRNSIWEQLVAPQKRQDLKAGHGGLIDIEFAAQYLQLVHGHDNRQLQTTSTIKALQAAATLNLVNESTCEVLIEGYRFLRRLEHRLRIVHDQSEHHLPDTPDELDKLARRSGYPDSQQLQEDYQMWTKKVHEAYLDVLGL